MDQLYINTKIDYSSPFYSPRHGFYGYFTFIIQKMGEIGFYCPNFTLGFWFFKIISVICFY